MTDASKWNNDTLKDFIELRIEQVFTAMHELEKRQDERFVLSQQSIAVANEQLDKRLENQNKWRESLNDAATRMATKSEVDTRITSLQEKVDILRQTNWPLLTAFGGICVSSIAAIWVIIGLKIDATNQPVVVALKQSETQSIARDRSIVDLTTQYNQMQQAQASENAQLSRDISTIMQNTQAGRQDREQLNSRMRQIESSVQGSVQADASSRTDRDQLNNRMRLIEQNFSLGIADRKGNEADFKQKLVEIETQFKAMSNHINGLTDQIEEWLKVIYAKVFPGATLPGTHFRPQLFKEPDK